MTTLNAQITSLRDQVNEGERTKTALERQLQNSKNENADLKNENDRLAKQLNQIEGNVATLTSIANASKTVMDSAYQQAKDAYDMAIADQKAKDQAVRERDDAVANLRNANAQIQQQNNRIESMQIQINDLNKDKGELALLVDVAKAKGFIEAMAVPTLRGTVAHVGPGGRLVTVSVTDNPSGAEIKPGYPFAIYEGSTYKGDAIVQEANSDRNVAFCRVFNPVRGTTIKEGDSAATQTQ